MGFKKGDCITLKDNPNDTAIKEKRQGYYIIEEVYEDGYSLYSFQKKHTLSYKNLKDSISKFVKDYEQLKSEGLEVNYPSHPGQYNSVRDLIDSSYRLMTETERTLYASTRNN